MNTKSNWKVEASAKMVAANEAIQEAIRAFSAGNNLRARQLATEAVSLTQTAQEVLAVSDTADKVSIEKVRPGEIISSDLINNIIDKIKSLEENKGIDTLLDLTGVLRQDSHSIYIIKNFEESMSMFNDGKLISRYNEGLHLVIMDFNLNIIKSSRYESYDKLEKELREEINPRIFIILGNTITENEFNPVEITPEVINQHEGKLRFFNFVVIGRIDSSNENLYDELDKGIQYKIRRRIDVRAANQILSGISVFGIYTKTGRFVLGSTNSYSTGSLLHLFGPKEGEF